MSDQLELFAQAAVVQLPTAMTPEQRRALDPVVGLRDCLYRDLMRRYRYECSQNNGLDDDDKPMRQEFGRPAMTVHGKPCQAILLSEYWLLLAMAADNCGRKHLGVYWTRKWVEQVTRVMPEGSIFAAMEKATGCRVVVHVEPKAMLRLVTQGPT